MADKLLIDNRDYNDDEYVPSDSEDNYSEEEKEILKEVRQGKRRQQDPKEVLAFADSDEEDDGDGDDDDDVGEMMGDSDIEGADDDGDIPDSKDWGSHSRSYYNTDFVDPDYSTYNEQEEEMAKQEEEEAKVIQIRLAKQMTEDDFLDKATLKMTSIKDYEALGADGQRESTKLKADFSGLSKRERQRLFQKDSPEFAGLIADFEEYLMEVETLTTPVLKYVRDHDVPMIPALKFAQLYQNIALTYCSNVAFYLLLKVKRIAVRSHPITKRLVQLRNLLTQLKDKHNNIIKPKLETLLKRICDGDKIEILATTKKSKPSILEAKSEPASKRVKLARYREDEKQEIDVSDSASDDDDAEQAAVEEDEVVAGDEHERRSITYQMAKNKGLMPQRKKEQRNPRVKHRSKFRKALIRRKGAVRTVRTETKRYTGEMSGIKASVSKSIKFRS